jgi:hypothetical protein
MINASYKSLYGQKKETRVNVYGNQNINKNNKGEPKWVGEHQEI